MLVYSCGSLWTSIIPCLALQGVGSAIAESGSLRAKVLLRMSGAPLPFDWAQKKLISSPLLSPVNSENDRETKQYTALDYVNAIVRTLNRWVAPFGFSLPICTPDASLRLRLARYDTPPPLPPPAPSSAPSSSLPPLKFLPSDVITHLVYLTDGKVPVDVSAIEALGIKVVPVSPEQQPLEVASGGGRKKVRFGVENVRRGLKDVLRSL